VLGDENEMAVGKDIYDVNEMFSRYHVDPDIAQQSVPSKWKVKVHHNGKALLLVMVQIIKKMVLDYVLNVGSVRMSHVWIELEGPVEVVAPLPGTSKSLPTWYWYIMPHQTDNRWASALMSSAGVPIQAVKEVSVGYPAGTRSGEVVEEGTVGRGYNWVETAQLYAQPDVVTGSHRFYRKYGHRESAAHTICYTHFLVESKVNLIASPDSAVGKLGFDTSLSGFSNPYGSNIAA
jgi:hypothetical protein